MSASERTVAWSADPVAQDLIERFPLPIALLDGAGGAPVLNDRFMQNFGLEALESAPLKDLIRNPAPDWRTVRLPAPRNGYTEVRAQVVQVRGRPVLILDDAADPTLQRELDHLHGTIAELERRVSVDPLTGAWNRAHFEGVAASEVDRSVRFRQPVSLILLDIDHFKRVNDAHGHQAGDAVLRELVRAVGGVIRSVDALFRWGGEEFVVIAPSTGYRAGAVLAEKIRSHVETRSFPGAGAVTISLGVAEHNATESAERWFRRADVALYRAKGEGRNRVCVDQHGSSDAWASESGPSVIRLVWQEAYECGEPTIDAEHREMFDLANMLFDATFRSETSPEFFRAALDKLMGHITRHFADEEVLLAKHGYKDLDRHKMAHAALLARADELNAGVATGRTRLGDLVEFLANTVIARHLFVADRKFFPLFKQSAA
jgi:diguanylate cyclase (GGDEF)-like protein/hemerythrin-like metal-binding protein